MSIRQPFREQQVNELQKLGPNNQILKKHGMTKLKSLTEDKNNSLSIFNQENMSKQNIPEALKIAVGVTLNSYDFNTSKSNIELKPIQQDKISKVNSFNNIKHKNSSPIIINKIEYLPKLDLNLNNGQFSTVNSQEDASKLNNMIKQIVKPENKIHMPSRRSSLTDVSSPPMIAKRPTRRPSFTAPNSRHAPMQTGKPELKPNKRKLLPMNISESIETKQTKTKDNSLGALNFDLSDSVVDFLQVSM